MSDQLEIWTWVIMSAFVIGTVRPLRILTLLPHQIHCLPELQPLPQVLVPLSYRQRCTDRPLHRVQGDGSGSNVSTVVHGFEDPLG
jgi:hypothetical protein